MPKHYLRFWGVRGSYPAPFASHMGIGGNTPCVELSLDDHTLIFDAGTGIIPFGQQLAERTAQAHLNIFLTHYHWDHISGLPFFIPAFTEGFEIDFHGPADSPQELEHHIAQQMKAPYFPIETGKWLANVRYHAPLDSDVTVGPATVSAFVLHHPGLTYGYRIEVAGKVILYCPDNEIFLVNQRIDAMREEFDEDERGLLEAMKEEQLGRVTEFMRDADILIHDAQYTPDDYQRKRGWGHSCFIDTVTAATLAEVKHLYLFSYDPSYDDAAVDVLFEKSRTIARDHQSPMVCHKTCEGLIIDLDD